MRVFCDARRAGVGDFPDAVRPIDPQHGGMDTVQAPGSTPLPPIAPGDRVPTTRAGGARDDVIAVTLFEDADGQMVVVDERIPGDRRRLGPILRIGRTRLALHYLAPTVVARLESTGQVTVEGPDALNVLLAFADGAGLADPVE